MKTLSSLLVLLPLSDHYVRIPIIYIQGLQMLSTVNLTQRYGKRVLFDKINITLDAGKRYGLIGANGAGKSTFLKILAGEIEQSDGEVQLQPGLKLGMLRTKPVCF